MRQMDCFTGFGRDASGPTSTFVADRGFEGHIVDIYPAEIRMNQGLPAKTPDLSSSIEECTLSVIGQL